MCKRIVSICLCIVLFLGFGATFVQANEISLSKITMFVGKKQHLITGNKSKSTKYFFVSSNPKVAKVNKKGVISAVKRGKSVITIKEKKKKSRIIGKIKIVVKRKKSNTTTPTSSVWKVLPDEFIFTSGAGGWATKITIGNDGSFVGEYMDSDMGDVGYNYPRGVVYICEFTGKFSKPHKISEHIYTMELEQLNTKNETGKIYYNDGMKYICSEPYGFESAKKFYIYFPGTKLSDIEEGFLVWSHLYDKNIRVLPKNYYGIYNISGKQGFVSYR